MTDTRSKPGLRVIPLPHPEVPAARLERLFATLDRRWFQPHDLGPAGARAIAAHAGDDVYLVLEADGELVGYGLLRGWDAGFAIPSLGIAIGRDHHRRGFGHALMDALEAAAATRGAERIRLRVSPLNEAARAMYEGRGYVVVGEERGEQVMAKGLTPEPG